MSDGPTLIRRCYALARAAVARGDHPFGALLAHSDGTVLLEAENKVATERDPTRHAELELISRAWRELGPEALPGTTLYTSTEPCVMCSGAIYWGGIHSLVFGVSARALEEFVQAEYVIPSREIYSRMRPRVEVVGPVLEEEGMAIHRDFWPRILGR